MKRITCPICLDKLKVLFAGNNDFARYIISKRGRKGGGECMKKVTRGSNYQMVFSCKCKGPEKRPKAFSIIGRSKAQVITRLGVWRSRLKKRLADHA